MATRIISMRASEAEYQAWKATAAKANMSLNAWLGMAASAHYSRAEHAGGLAELAVVKHKPRCTCTLCKSKKP